MIVNYSFTGISGCLEFELEVSLVAWIRLGGCCLVYSPILRSRRFRIFGFRSLHYQIQEDTRLAILLVKYRSLSYLNCTPLGAQKSCSVYTNDWLCPPILIHSECFLEHHVTTRQQAIMEKGITIFKQDSPLKFSRLFAKLLATNCYI